MNPKDIPVFILAGGFGTRISEETALKPKPMIEIGGMPILVHIMRYYYRFGFNDFVICAGYMSWEIKDYFLNYKYRGQHLEIDHRQDIQKAPNAHSLDQGSERWRVRVIETGLDTMTGGRLARAMDWVNREQAFKTCAVTYGDGLTDADLGAELKFHQQHGKTGTVLGVLPTSRFGEMKMADQGQVLKFVEKPEAKSPSTNGGFFFFNQGFRGYLSDQKDCVLEREPLENLVAAQELHAFEHAGFWHCMDTLRDKIYLQSLWEQEKLP